MGSLIDEEMHLGNGDPSLLTPQPKCKRQKVSAAPGFSSECGPNDTSLYKHTKEKGVQTIGELNADDILKEVLKDIKSFTEDVADLSVDNRNDIMPEDSIAFTEIGSGVSEQGLKFTKSCSRRQVKQVEGPANLSPARLNAKVSNRKKRSYDTRYNQQRYLTRSKCSAEKVAESTNSIIPNPKDTKTDGLSRPSALIDDKAYSKDEVEPKNLSSTPVSAKVNGGNKRSYARDNQRRYLTRSKCSAEKLAEKTDSIIPNPKDTKTDEFSRPSAVIDDGAYSKGGVEPKNLISTPVSAKENKGKKRGFDAQNNQQRYLTRSKCSAEKLAEKTESIIPNPKDTKTDEFSRSSTVIDEGAYSKGGVEPKNLISTPVSAKVNEGKKRGFDARDNQQNYLTRSKCSAEKLAEKTESIISNPKDTKTDAFSRPSAVIDGGAYSKGGVEPKNLISTPVSAKVNEGKKRGFDARDNQQRYLTRSKCSAEKLAGKTDLVIPNPKDTKTDEFSRPSALIDDEAYSKDEVEPENLTLIPVSANVNKEKKHGFNSRDNQQRYLTRSKCSAETLEEKSVLITLNPKEMEKIKFSQPTVLGDDVELPFDEAKGPVKLSPSLVSAKVRKTEKLSYNARDNQQRYLTRSKYNAEKLKQKSVLIIPNPKETENYCENGVKRLEKLSLSQVSPSVSRGKKCDNDARESQQRYLMRSKCSAEKTGEKPVLSIPIPKETEGDEISRPLALGDDEDYCKDDVKRPAKLSSTRVSAALSESNKCGHDTREIQQRYLISSSKYNVEQVAVKSVSVIPNPKEMETDKVFRPVTPGDDEDCSVDEAERPAKLSPSLVSPRLSKENKNDYDVQDEQHPYLTRNIYNTEKLTEKSMLTIRNPKVTETDEVSRQLAFGDDEDNCEDEVKRPAKLNPSRVNLSLSKGEKRDYDARDNQQRYLTRSRYSAEMVADKSQSLAPDDGTNYSADKQHVSELRPESRRCDITLPPFVVRSSGEKGARTKVRETLRLFHVLVRKILQGEETNSVKQGTAGEKAHMRAADMLKAKGICINPEKVIGAVPGVEIGDIFSYRLELAIIGLHTPLLSGLDTIKQDNLYVATSVVAPEGYYAGNSDSLIYTSECANPIGVDKRPEDQKLEQGNLALNNCIDKKSPVRVIRFKESKPSDTGDDRPKMIGTYTYDGLFTVERFWSELGPHGKLVYKFKLIRMPGQHRLTCKKITQYKSCKVRQGHCVDDISNGKEKLPIGAVNTIDNEKPPPFTYITSNMYPNWCQPLPGKGCDCKGKCSDSKRCACTTKNGGEIPYNLSGAIVEAKPLVYECGPSCKCPPSCSNRVSQHGLKLPLEIFKTGSMGWGVRCLSSIRSGSFICEYVGELLDDREAEERVGSDEYLFDIGQNSNNATEIGFTIDAAWYGNIGRFINHSCSPNLYAQNVLYDHGDERIPHVMLFAAENIPPLQELTYHYNYAIDQVFDSKGNIKKKSCYCGSAECTGRMY